MINQIQLIRNASLKITYNNSVFLVDPMFSKTFTFESFALISKNPTVDLACSIPSILNGVEAIFLTHKHVDHFDDQAASAIDKSLPFFVQKVDYSFVKAKGFNNLIPYEDNFSWNQINFSALKAFHGRGQLLTEMGSVTGLFFKSGNLPSVYIVGDSIYNDSIKQNIEDLKPDYIIINSGGAEFPDKYGQNIIMNAAEVKQLIKDLNFSTTIIAIHMNAIDHCKTTRTSLKEELKTIPESVKLIIPEDGEMIEI